MKKELTTVEAGRAVDPAVASDIEDSTWWQQEHGQQLGAEHVAYGINRWEKNGFVSIRLHHCADPAKSPLTAEGRAFIESIRDLPTYARKQEYGIDFTVTPGRPVYCDADRMVLKSQVYRPWLVLFRTWDWGWNMPAVVYFQVQPCDRNRKPVVAGVKAERWTVHFLREVIWRHILLTEFADSHVLPVVPTFYPGARVEDVGDVAGKYDREAKTGQTSVELLRTRGIDVHGREMTVLEGVEIWQSIISAGDFEADPVTCRTVVDGLRSGYVRDDDGIPIKDGFYEHVMDAGRYGLGNVFRLNSASNRIGQRTELARLVTVATAAAGQGRARGDHPMKRPTY